MEFTFCEPAFFFIEYFPSFQKIHPFDRLWYGWKFGIRLSTDRAHFKTNKELTTDPQKNPKNNTIENEFMLHTIERFSSIDIIKQIII